MRIAKAAGWKVNVLDKNSNFDLIENERERQWKKDKTADLTEIERYMVYDLREKRWATLLRRDATPNDIVIIHPAHVDGLIHQSNFNPKQVVWIHQDAREGFYPRPDPIKLKKEFDERMGRRRPREK